MADPSWRSRDDAELEAGNGLHLEPSGDRVSSHVLMNGTDQSRVRVIGAGEIWLDGEVKKALKDG